MKASAVVFPEPNKVEFREVTCPDPGPQHVVVRLTHSWISVGTEGSFLRGERITGDTPYYDGGPWPFPIVPGYQGVGVVEAVGEKITDLSPGDTVYRNFGNVEGMYFDLGGHISPSVCQRDWVWKLPPSPRPVAFSGLLLAQVGVNCGTRASNLEQGDSALVIGDGPVAQWTAQTMARRGAKVCLTGMEDDRLALAEKLAGAKGINVLKEEWVEVVRQFAPEGLAVAADAAGSIESIEKIIPLMRRRGHIVSAGYYGANDRISLQSLRDLELSVECVSGATGQRITQTLNLVAEGSLQTLPLITHHFPVEQAARAWATINAVLPWKTSNAYDDRGSQRRFWVQRKEPLLGVILDWK